MNAVESKLLNDPNEEYSKKLVSIEADAREVLSTFYSYLHFMENFCTQIRCASLFFPRIIISRNSRFFPRATAKNSLKKMLGACMDGKELSKFYCYIGSQKKNSYDATALSTKISGISFSILNCIVIIDSFF